MPGKTIAKMAWYVAKHHPWFPMRRRMLEGVRRSGYAGLGGKTVRVKMRTGAIMEVDPLDEEGWALLRDREIQPEVAGVLRDLLHHGDGVLDIGAGYGYFTLLACGLVGPKGHVYAFEPNLTVANQLAQNVGLNDYTNVRLHKVAVSNEVGTARFHVAPQHTGLSSLGAPDGEKTTAMQVPTATIDSFASELPHVKLARIDAGGAELPALEGMHDLIGYDHPYIILEVDSRAIQRVHGDAAGVFSMLHGFNYATYEVGPRGTHPLRAPKGDQRTTVLAAAPGSHVPGLGAARQ
jgi:FkbM family methyltransferase